MCKKHLYRENNDGGENKSCMDKMAVARLIKYSIIIEINFFFDALLK